MREHGRFKRRMDIWMSEDLYTRLEAEATRHGQPVATLTRKILERGLAEEAAIEGREVLTAAVRRAIMPTENRLAKQVARAAMAGATAMYLNTQVIADMGKRDAAQLYDVARKKASFYLKEPLNEPEQEKA